MSGFDRALGAMSARNMLECARGLLRFLAGEAGGSSTLAASGGIGDVGRVGGRGDFPGGEVGELEYGVRELAAAGRAGREVRRSRGGESARRGDFDEAGDAERARGDVEALDAVERRGRGTLRLTREREIAARAELDGYGGAGAAFAGPERRYDNAVGARGMEMGRVSDYFRRDSRRYDAGYTKF